MFLLCVLTVRDHYRQSVYDAVHRKGMVTVGPATNEMVGKQIFFWSRENERNSTLHASPYKMNFPRKNAMKTAAITTRSEGRGPVTFSLKDAVEVDPVYLGALPF